MQVIPSDIDCNKITDEKSKGKKIMEERSLRDKIKSTMKYKYAHVIFTILMIMEAMDFISDGLQLHEVVTQFSKYNAAPFAPNIGTDNREFTVFWEVSIV